MIDDKSSAFISEAFDLCLKYYFSLICEDNDFIQGDGFFRSYSGFKSPNHNIFYQDVIRNEKLPEMIKETINYFSEKGVPFTWWISDETINDHIKSELINNNLRYFGEIWGLAINLVDLVKSFDTPNSLYVERLKSSEQLGEWSRIAATTFGIRNNASEELESKLRKYDMHDENINIKRYMAYLSGDPVSVSSLVFKEGVAAIFDDEVIPYYAKYDPFKFCIIYYPLIEAKKSGIKVGIGFADPKRINMYRFLGFEKVYKYHKFVYVPKKR